MKMTYALFSYMKNYQGHRVPTELLVDEVEKQVLAHKFLGGTWSTYMQKLPFKKESFHRKVKRLTRSAADLILYSAKREQSIPSKEALMRGYERKSRNGE